MKNTIFAFEIKVFNPFPCGSLWNAHSAASGPKSPDKIGLFGPVLPGENISSHSYGPIGEAPYVALRGKNWVRYSHSHSVLGMKPSFYKKVYKRF